VYQRCFCKTTFTFSIVGGFLAGGLIGDGDGENVTLRSRSALRFRRTYVLARADKVIKESAGINR